MGVSLEVDVKRGENRRVRFRSRGIEEVRLNGGNGDRQDSSQWLQTGSSTHRPGRRLLARGLG